MRYIDVPEREVSKVSQNPRDLAARLRTAACVQDRVKELEPRLEIEPEAHRDRGHGIEL